MAVITSRVPLIPSYVVTNLVALAGGFSAALCAKTGPKTMGVGLFAAAAVSCLLLGLFPLAGISVLAMILLRLCFSLMQPLHMELQNQRITGRNRATALSMNAVVMESLGIFLNLVYGRLAEQRLDRAMFLGAVLCAGGAVLYWRSFPR